MKRIIIISVFGVIVAAGVFAVLSAALQPVEVTTGIVTRGKAQETVYATGHVEARELRLLRANRAAVIDKIYTSPRTGRPFDAGDAILVGEPLLRLRDSALEARKRAARAEIERVDEKLADHSALRESWKLRISEAERIAEDQRAREKRLKSQLEGGGVSRDAYDQARTNADVSEQRVAQLRQEYAQVLEDLQAAKVNARSQLETLDAQERDNVIAAPVSGVILTLPLERGEFAPLGAELAKVGDIRDILIESEVNEDDIGRVREGQEALIRLAGYENTVIRGAVEEIRPDADRSTKGYTVRVAFNDITFVAAGETRLRGVNELPGGIRPRSGMTAELGIVVRDTADTLTFPRPALTNNNTVFVVGENNRVSEVKIELGLVNFSRAEARSGLKDGDRVVTSNLKNLSDGSRVKPTEE